MEKILKKRKFGLIGKDISYSFSRHYFTKKFQELKLEDHEYVNFDLPTIKDFSKIDLEEVNGFNVTIPYKEKIMEFLDEVDEVAEEIGAVNTIKIIHKNKLIGYNTDYYGFEESLKPSLKSHHKKALVLGTGGASKAILFVLNKLNIEYKVVSRTPKNNQISYQKITKKLLNEYNLIINSTPLGTYPDIENCPNIPYQHLTDKHLLFDLIYNPEKTTFLSKGEAKGANIINGLKMLELQAEKAWSIWNM
ncbi:shikimate dehydrogenase [Aureibaculum sp. 2210JD6-5]|uniref:shikimate dehydrogenase family protein n=1 Tax=Aureibaculum sp. 2210JD6-5 TaxID=3103957 RepID=UPI002AAD0D2E|nr:shikimate dehydrogenase [Aureibaculum sp. 2210JD6-5]MDY7393667.1 shikimate dehydrogenase [Aureibaculum sp. 2210JD6-5]